MLTSGFFILCAILTLLLPASDLSVSAREAPRPDQIRSVRNAGPKSLANSFYEADNGQGQNVDLIGQIGGDMRAVVTQGDHIYVGIGPGLVVFDSTPNNPTVIGQTAPLPDLITDLAIAGRYAYVADGDSGLRIVDITDPTAPNEVSAYDTPGFASGVAVAGRYAYIADGGSGLRIVDIVNPAAPHEVGAYDTPGYAASVMVAGRYAYVADGVSGLRVVDVAVPTVPREVGAYDTPGSAGDIAVAGTCAIRC